MPAASGLAEGVVWGVVAAAGLAAGAVDGVLAAPELADDGLGEAAAAGGVPTPVDALAPAAALRATVAPPAPADGAALVGVEPALTVASPARDTSDDAAVEPVAVGAAAGLRETLAAVPGLVDEAALAAEPPAAVGLVDAALPDAALDGALSAAELVGAALRATDPDGAGLIAALGDAALVGAVLAAAPAEADALCDDAGFAGAPLDAAEDSDVGADTGVGDGTPGVRARLASGGVLESRFGPLPSSSAPTGSLPAPSTIRAPRERSSPPRAKKRASRCSRVGSGSFSASAIDIRPCLAVS